MGEVFPDRPTHHAYRPHPYLDPHHGSRTALTSFLTDEEEAALLAAIDVDAWKMNRARTRRIQMFGVHHDDRYTSEIYM